MQYADYYWKKGRPRGTGTPTGEISYKVVQDPYFKRISVEQYRKNTFSTLIYDSLWLDFRRLTPEHQNAWQRLSIPSPNPGEEHYLIRDHDDRTILREAYTFDGDLCRTCRIFTPQGLFLAHQKVLYTLFGDPFDGVTLFDPLDKPILTKKYRFDPTTKSFTDLLSETWDFTPQTASAQTSNCSR
ncbi:MAG: hypothetical protein KDK65_01325 [Chlamydiia bacterium]|nr:hypothetical protein [Chlamydiia bacterium]